MYNGSPERYDWKLVGKQEIYVPYNAYQLHSNKLKYERHPEAAAHQPGARALRAAPRVGRGRDAEGRHSDTSTSAAPSTSTRIPGRSSVVDCYDNRDQLWRVQEGHSINYYDVPTFWTTLETTYDLQAGRYLALGLDNEEPQTFNFNAKRTRRRLHAGRDREPRHAIGRGRSPA